MYLSIDFNIKNIYLYQKYSGPVICKNNFSYKITNNEIYNKIIGIISNFSNRDILQIFDNDKIKISMNTTWCLKNLKNIDQSIKRNILIPNIQYLDLFDNNIDLNDINYLCHDNTHIIDIPDITIIINGISYLFSQWTGNNQLWCCALENSINYTYAYLYIFPQKSILLVSQTLKNSENHYSDLDIMSISDHNNIIQDEYGRIDCYNYEPVFSKIDILNNPTNQFIEPDQIIVETKTKCHTV